MKLVFSTTILYFRKTGDLRNEILTQFFHISMKFQIVLSEVHRVAGSSNSPWTLYWKATGQKMMKHYTW